MKTAERSCSWNAAGDYRRYRQFVTKIEECADKTEKIMFGNRTCD